MAGVVIWLGSHSQTRLLSPTTPTLFIGLLGLTVGTVANICLYQSLGAAPNPGLPVAIVTMNSVAAYIITPVLVVLLPRYFQKMEFTWQHFIGVTLVVVGTILIAIKR